MKHRVSQKKLFSGHLINVVGNNVASENNYVELEAFQVPDVSLVVPITNNYEFILVEQYRHAVNELCVEFPAGKIKDGELAIEAAKRELLEETGLDSNFLELIGTIFSSPEYGLETIYVFKTTDFKIGLASPEIYENIKIRKIPEGLLRDMIKTGEIKDAKTIASYTLLKLQI
mgnify:CR=1 FL=1